jgi:hypothetical protein
MLSDRDEIEAEVMEQIEASVTSTSDFQIEQANGIPDFEDDAELLVLQVQHQRAWQTQLLRGW